MMPQLAATGEVPHARAEPDVTRIIVAARRVLERSHFRSLKVRQVLLASHTSASNFYRHFPSKAHLLLALLDEEAERAEHRLAKRMAAAGDAEAQLRTWLAFHVQLVHTDAYLEQVRLFRDPALLEQMPDQVTGTNQVLHQLLLATIRRGVEEGVFRSDEPAADAQVVQNVVRGLLADGLAGQFTGTEEEVLDRTHRFVLRALGHQAPQRVGTAAA